MPIQEALITDPAQLHAPCGVSFDTPGDKFRTKEQDRASWAAQYEATAGSLQLGWVVVVLIQARNTRDWDRVARQFKFNPREDYLVSGWLVQQELCKPYRPGTVLERWFGETESRLGLPSGNTEQIHNFWNCDPKSCKLSRQGPTFLITSLRDRPEAECISRAKEDFANGQKFGWRGRVPGWVRAAPNRAARGDFTVARAWPRYQ